ncbi:MAG: hypothetical protein AB4426_00230 [Xenococcaceae cyanobacterium]
MANKVMRLTLPTNNTMPLYSLYSIIASNFLTVDADTEAELVALEKLFEK